MTKRSETPFRLVLCTAAIGTLAFGVVGCSEPVGPEAQLCSRLVRFHLGLHHPVEIVDSESPPGKPHVRIAFQGTRSESGSVDGTALCRLSERTGELQLIGAQVDGRELESGAIQAFNKFVAARRRAGG